MKMTIHSLLLASMVGLVFSNNPLSILDTNSDGYIEESEFPGGVPAGAFEGILRVFDTNKDGKISLDEYSAGSQQAQAASGDRNKQIELSAGIADANGNGFIEQGELPGTIGEQEFNLILSQVDSNNDGKISTDEYIEFAKKQAGGGASCITVATSMLSLTVALYLLW
jgi:Ca2+-binding EF-hand superfamily protein